MLYSRSLLVIHFKYRIMCMTTPNSPSTSKIHFQVNAVLFRIPKEFQEELDNIIWSSYLLSLCLDVVFDSVLQSQMTTDLVIYFNRNLLPHCFGGSEVQNQGDIRAVLPPKALGEILLWDFLTLGALGIPRLVAAWLTSVSSFHMPCPLSLWFPLFLDFGPTIHPDHPPRVISFCNS